jgi:hypothetical protein
LILPESHEISVAEISAYFYSKGPSLRISANNQVFASFCAFFKANRKNLVSLYSRRFSGSVAGAVVLNLFLETQLKSSFDIF